MSDLKATSSSSEPATPVASGLSLEDTSSAATVSSPAFGSAAPRSGDELSLKDLFDLVGQSFLIIRAKWYWGVAAFLVTALGLGFLVARKPAEFKAQTMLLAQGTLDRVVGANMDDNRDATGRENTLRNHLSVMDSRKFRVMLVDALTDAEKKQILAPYLVPPGVSNDDYLVGLLEGNISIERERGREFFNIQVTHRDEKVALMIAERFTTRYIQLVQQEFREANKAGLQLLLQQADVIRQELAKEEEERLEFRRKNNIISRSDNQSILGERLRRLDATLTDTRLKRLLTSNLLETAKEDFAKQEYPWDNAYLATYANNAALRQELDRLLAQRTVLAARYGAQHTKMRDIDASIKGVTDNIKRNFELAVRDLEAQLEAVVQTETQVKKEFDEAFGLSIEIEKLATRYELIGASVEDRRAALQQLNSKISSARISSQLPADFMQVVDSPSTVKPRIPKKVINLLIVLFLACGVGVTAPLVANMLDERVKGTSDIEALLGRPMATAIPKLAGSDDERAHIVRDKIDLVSSEAFSTVAGFLDLNGSKVFPKVILQTSTLPGEGKSMISSNLASAFTALNRKTILIDLDLRRPTQQRVQGIKAEGGFLPWAKAGFPFENLFSEKNPLNIQHLPDGTDLIIAGGDEAQPGHYFVGKQLTALIEELKRHYEVIILDTPPAGLFQDSLILARHAPDRLLVVRDSKVPVAQVKKVISDFARAKFPFTAIILNGFNPKAAHAKLAYSYKSAQEGYSYTAKK